VWYLSKDLDLYKEPNEDETLKADDITTKANNGAILGG
jgi:hypothetical protein